jgi:hypothetical protein
MTKETTQKEEIAKWLNSGKKLNSFQAIKLFGCTKLSTRCGELEREGKIPKLTRGWLPVQTRFCEKVTVRTYQVIK